MTSSSRTRLVAGACALVLASTAAPAAEPDAGARPGHRPGAAAMLFDGLVARPVGLGLTVIGAGAFVVTLPFSASGGNVDAARERLVEEPTAYTFKRCLGCLEAAPAGHR